MNVAIIGSGLIGGSIGLALKKHVPGCRVTVVDQNPEAARRAVELGAADVAAESVEAAVEGRDIVFVATPVRVIPDVVRRAGEGMKDGAIITDVGSTKSHVVVEVERDSRLQRLFIGGHPMAGSEDEGVEAARANLFDGAWWILTPTERSDPDGYRRLHQVLTTLGARVMAIDPARHDELMAIVSHVPQLTATALMGMAAARGEEHAGLLALAAGGFRDMTRVAASNPDIWVDVCRDNADAISAALGSFIERLETLRELLKRGDEDQLRSLFTQARSSRRGLPGKTIEGDPYEVRMPVPDRPGVLAEVTTSVGDLGINIEDLQISHVAEGGRGTLHLTVAGHEPATRISEALSARGYEPTVHAL